MKVMHKEIMVDRFWIETTRLYLHSYQKDGDKKNLLKKGLLAWAGLATFGLSDFINVDVKGMKLTGLVSDVMKELTELTKTREDEDTKGDEGPPQVVPIGEEIEAYEDTYAMSPWERIKANQAKRAMLVEKGIIQENPIVDESVTDITMTANSGGLANLFRVKNK